MRKTNFMMKLLSIMSSMAFLFSILAANSTCFYYTYQPKEPDSLKKFKKC